MTGNKITIPQTVLPQRRNWANLRFAVGHYLEMFKLHLCLYIGFSTVFGHVMANQSFSFDSLVFGFFVFILACGSAVLNNIQDREYDSFFLRTNSRSLPQKRVPLSHAKIIAIMMIGFGLSGLLIAQTLLSIFFGILAILCYNGVYTPLKKRSLMAIIPGSLVGILAPLIGWSAAGEAMTGPNLLILLSIFGLWQIPHFFIVVLKTRGCQAGNYKSNKFPCFTKKFSKNEIILQALIWTNLYSLAILLFLINGSIQNQILSIICGINAIGITLFMPAMIYTKQNFSFAFGAINLSMLFFMGAGIWDKCVL